MTASIIRFGSEQKAVGRTFDSLQPMSITGLTDGGWVITWQEFSQGLNEYEIYQQRIRADGTAVNEPAKVNTYAPHAQELPKVTALPHGGWIVTWQSYWHEGIPGYGVYQRRYDADGIEIDEVEQRVTTATNNFDEKDPGITVFDDEGWVVIWTSAMSGG